MNIMGKLNNAPRLFYGDVKNFMGASLKKTLIGEKLDIIIQSELHVVIIVKNSTNNDEP